jgi:hypothetical protein
MRVSKVNHPGMEGYVFKCPGCTMDHMAIVGYTPEYRESRQKSGFNCPVWGFNDSLDRPTFTPSLLVQWTEFPTYAEHKRIMAGKDIELPKQICHSFITDGRIQFLNDCTHLLKGQTVDLAERTE